MTSTQHSYDEGDQSHEEITEEPVPETSIDDTESTPTPEPSEAPDASFLVTQVAERALAYAREQAEQQAAIRSHDHYYAIYNVRGLRRDIKKQICRMIPDPIVPHFKGYNPNFAWDMLDDTIFFHPDEQYGDDWYNVSVPLYELDVGTVDWIVERLTMVKDRVELAASVISPGIQARQPDWVSFVREDSAYFILPDRKLSKLALHLLKAKVGECLLKRTDIHAGLEIDPQWHHTLYFLELCGIPAGKKWDRRIHIPGHSLLASFAFADATDFDAAELQKLTTFDNQAMRRTSWDSIYIPKSEIDLDLIETEAAKHVFYEPPPAKPRNVDKGKQPEPDILSENGIPRPHPPGTDADQLFPEALVADASMNEKPESLLWVMEGEGLRVELRRTVSLWLHNVAETV